MEFIFLSSRKQGFLLIVFFRVIYLHDCTTLHWVRCNNSSRHNNNNNNNNNKTTTTATAAADNTSPEPWVSWTHPWFDSHGLSLAETQLPSRDDHRTGRTFSRSPAHPGCDWSVVQRCGCDGWLIYTEKPWKAHFRNYSIFSSSHERIQTLSYFNTRLTHWLQIVYSPCMFDSLLKYWLFLILPFLFYVHYNYNVIFIWLKAISCKKKKKSYF